MTMAQVEKRLAALERQLGRLQEDLEYQQTVEGIRRGLESADRGEGEPARRAFSVIRQNHKPARR